jgi:hypothetical protein
VCSEANFRGNYFSTTFSLTSSFKCEASGRTWLGVWTHVALPIIDLAVCCSNKLVSHPNTSPTCISPSLSRTGRHILFKKICFLFVFLCGFLVFYFDFLALCIFSCILSSHFKYFYCSFGSFKFFFNTF